jgi:NAD+ diphosphatase
MTCLWLVGTVEVGLNTAGGSLGVHVTSCTRPWSPSYLQAVFRDWKHFYDHKKTTLRLHRRGAFSCNHCHSSKQQRLGTFVANTSSSKYIPQRLLMNDKGLLNTFSRSPLDRLNNHRNQASLVEECEKSNQVRYVIFFQREPLLKLQVGQDHPEGNAKSSEQAHIAWFTKEHHLVQQILETGRQALLLGKWTEPQSQCTGDASSSEVMDKYCFVLDATGVWDSDQIAQIEAQPTNIRSLLYKVRFDPQEAAVLAHAQSLLEFHARHQYCGKCGVATRVEGMGSKRVCSSGCGMEWFPRSDPVIIVAVVNGDYLLMGRQASWPIGRYSVIAGFMEHGESIEDAIYREVKEETFIQVGRCRYHSSQPWPFPYSLMLGFVAEASTQTIQVDKHELEDAKWFSREQVKEMLSNQRQGTSGLRGPPPQSIAYELCHAFISGDEICHF